MIDEKATYEKFGYYSIDLKPQSHKRIIGVCDGCGKVRILNKSKYSHLCKSCSIKGRKHTEAAKKKISEGHRGEKNHNYGKHLSEVTRKKMSESRRGRKHTEESRKKMSEATRGKKHPLYGKHPSEATRKKLSEAGKCRIILEETRKKLSGENNHQWKGGKSIEYCSKWNDHFREYIRDKYGRKCFLCDKTEEENGKRLSVHHVNGNKNCGCDNDITCQFIPLCASCHGKVHTSKKDCTETITNKMKCELKGWYI